MPRLPPDAPRIKETIVIDAEHGRAFHKERAAFLKEFLVSGEVETGRVCLYLSKIGVDGGVERNARGDAVLDIGADVSPQICIVI